MPCPNAPQHPHTMNDLETVRPEQIVSIVFTLSDANGKVLDRCSAEAPVRFLCGAQNVLPGLERRLLGARVGERRHVAVPAEEGYGLRDGEPQEVPRSVFPKELELQVGYKFMARSDDGKPFPLWVVRLDEQSVWVDANHPLAGQTLFFEVEVVQLRAATADELASGYPHSGCEACKP